MNAVKLLFRFLHAMKASVFVLLSLTVALVSSFEYSTEWEAWKAQHGKKYASKELELVRQEIFESNMKFVEEHNKNADKHGFTTAMNEFGDLVSPACGRSNSFLTNWHA